MENATKALIIAASILIAIVLISLAVMVLGGGTQMVKDNSDMSGTEITAYNSKWEAYFGKISGSKVKQLVNAVNQNNRTAEDASKKISISSNVANMISGSIDNGYTLGASFRSGDSYDVGADTRKDNKGYRNSGMLDGIKIDK